MIQVNADHLSFTFLSLYDSVQFFSLSCARGRSLSLLLSRPED